MTGTGTNPDCLTARAVLTRIAMSSLSTNPTWTRVPGGISDRVPASSPVSFDATPREKSASSAPRMAAAAS